jgi:bifunctional enzyme CysN/CysC
MDQLDFMEDGSIAASPSLSIELQRPGQDTAPLGLLAKKSRTYGLEGVAHILTCGSVDDGKSTLIGRLLWEASGLPDDQRAMLHRAAEHAGHPERLDYSLLLDGLAAEREQGITIDIAWRYIDTKRRRFVLIDAPGHDQYTCNMACGASHADAAVMLTDARHGIKEQTRRHAAILHLMGVRCAVLAVNKMDLVDWNESRFREIEQDFFAGAGKLGFDKASAIPLSARHGDNIASKSANMPWYKGQTLIDLLEGISSADQGSGQPFRMPVQTVLRDSQDFRGLAGTISSGSVRPGDMVVDTATGRSGRVLRIATMDGDLNQAVAGKAVALVLDTGLDISRGAILAAPEALPVYASSIEARIVWLASAAFKKAQAMLLRTATDLVPVTKMTITAHAGLDTLSMTPATGCAQNDIAAASISLGRPAALDCFREFRETGVFLLVDFLTGATLAAGIVSTASAHRKARQAAVPAFKITRARLEQGLCSDLDESDLGLREFKRRSRELARLFEAAGIKAVFEDAGLNGEVVP